MPPRGSMAPTNSTTCSNSWQGGGRSRVRARLGLRGSKELRRSARFVIAFRQPIESPTVDLLGWLLGPLSDPSLAPPPSLRLERLFNFADCKSQQNARAPADGANLTHHALRLRSAGPLCGAILTSCLKDMMTNTVNICRAMTMRA
jgi:hypothetical protein